MMKRLLAITLCLLYLLTLSACVEPTEETTSFTAMDTLMSLKIYGGESLCETLEARAHELDKKLSSADPDSEIYRLNEDHTASLSDDVLTLVRRSLELSKELKDAFDPTVYPAVCEWGFISGNYHVPDDATLKRLAEHIDSASVTLDGDTVTLADSVMLDLGAIAKGYLVDEYRKILDDSSAAGGVLNLGGTILLYGEKPDHTPFKVGIADPENPAGYFGYLTCSAGVVATSGGYERYFEENGVRYIHILDPTTAKPVDNGTLSVTIFCDDGTAADALSTALFVMGIDKATDYYRTHDGFDFIILTDDDRLYITDGVYDDFTLADGFDLTMVKVTK